MELDGGLAGSAPMTLAYGEWQQMLPNICLISVKRFGREKEMGSNKLC